MAHVINGVLRVVWNKHDVLSLDESLTHEECINVLERVARAHDAAIGINWDVIQFHIDEGKAEKNET